MGFDLSLSASKLNLLRECPRCFYDVNVKKIPRPDSIVASVTGGIDRTAKTYFDAFRGHVPTALMGKVPGCLYTDLEQMKKMRHWKSGLKAEVEVLGLRVSVIGALDDLLMEPASDHKWWYSPLDAKSKGDRPKDDGSKYYQAQSDIYALLLEKNGFTPSGQAYFAYFWPEALLDGTTLSMAMGCEVCALRSDPQEAVALIGRAVEVLKSGQPNSNPDCTFCRFADVRAQAVLQAVQLEIPNSN